MSTDEKISTTSTAKQQMRAKMAMHFCWVWKTSLTHRQPGGDTAAQSHIFVCLSVFITNSSACLMSSLSAAVFILLLPRCPGSVRFQRSDVVVEQYNTGCAGLGRVPSARHRGLRGLALFWGPASRSAASRGPEDSVALGAVPEDPPVCNAADPC
ncbi:hypothetical protein EYF80_018537 [Liparis tanakae]|uniref:Uncharacterized protein n=1 Tax=Liparis tanakae TaxID=230148 RepID=A0A4Z2HZA9_9TELE|nr:hypothetical protein EYF80_018537 [Liparis tanakae]